MHQHLIDVPVVLSQEGTWNAAEGFLPKNSGSLTLQRYSLNEVSMAQAWKMSVEMPLRGRQNRSLGVVVGPGETMKLQTQSHQDHTELQTVQTTLGMK